MTAAKQLPAIGSTIEAIRPADSFYKRVRGTVTGYRKDRVKIEATEVMSKWDTEWSDHPTSCSVTVSAQEII